MKQLPLYQCHKRVRATKIVEINSQYNVLTDKDRTMLVLSTGDFVALSDDFLARCPQLAVGGYYVQYLEGDGYSSYSPAGPFESGYTLVNEDPYDGCNSAPVDCKGLADCDLETAA